MLLITADTIITFEGEVFEKPESEDHAFSMIKKYSGKTHQALTSVWLTIISPMGDILKQKNFTESTDVRFAELDDSQIEAYVKSGEPFGKAGGYGIQGLGGSLISGITGCFYNVWGFPIHSFCVELRQILLKL